MTQLRTYAVMASNVYDVPDGGAMLKGLSGWTVYNMGAGSDGSWRAGTSDSSGFKGCIYKSSSEIVVCYKGTGGGALLRDILADAKLAMGIVPREASAAKNLFENALKVFGGVLPITLVGHSLGGGLCQVIGHWFKVRFVTFNAPPMGSTIQKAKVNFLKPQQMVRAIKASHGPGADGHNYRLDGDPVSARVTSALGHYGSVTTFMAPGVGVTNAHWMTVFIDYLNRSSDGLIDPFE
ncbi:MAG: hypothetical protein U1F52_14945 [Burkholderiales bacterium]